VSIGQLPQNGVGYQILPGNIRQVPAQNSDTGIPSFTNPPGGSGTAPANGGFETKNIFVFHFDLTNIFVDTLIDIPGTIVFFSGQSGGIAAPLLLKFDKQSNDPISLPFDRAFSGIRFTRLFISNPTTQAGITAEITVMIDQPLERVGING